METLRNLLRLAAWTFLHPLEVDRQIQATGTAWPARWVWCALAAGFGLLLSWLLLDPGNLVWFLLPPVLGPMLVLLGSVWIQDTGTDAFGIMMLGVLCFFLACPATKIEQAKGFSWSQLLPVAGILAVFGGGLAAGAMLTRAGSNRSFLFLPIGLLICAALPLLPAPPMVLQPLVNVAGKPPAAILAALTAVLLFVLRMVAPQVVLRSFQHLSNTASCAYLPLTAFRRRLAFFYVLGGAASLLAARFVFTPARSMAVGFVFLAMAVFELDLPQTLILSVRRVRWPALLFRIPGLPFSPPGLTGYLARVRHQLGDQQAASLAVDLILRTGYREPAEAAIEELRRDDYYLGLEINRRLAAEWPRPPDEEGGGARPAVASSATQKALVIPQLSPRDFAGAAFRDLLLAHRYEAPRGKEGAPLAAWPLWFPVAQPPMETMTLPQVVYRSLASVREPFRRTQILVADREKARATFTDLLDWAVGWASSSLGASLIPVALSLERLAADPARLAELSGELVRARSGAGGVSAVKAGRRACRDLIVWGSPDKPSDPEALTLALEGGNAWLLIEDDRKAKTDLKPVRRALDLVFGVAGLSHAAIVVVTPDKRCRVLSDVQTFGVEEPRKAKPNERRPRGAPRRFVAAVLRMAAACGSPSKRASLWIGGLLGLALLVALVSQYETLVQLWAAAQKSPPGMNPARVRILPLFAPFALPVFGMFAGYKWGLFWGSEEVRQASVHTLISGMFAGLLLLLALLPKSMTPGVGKTVLVTLAALPGTVVLALALLTCLGLAADVVWLIVSRRLGRRLNSETLASWAERYRVVLHLGSAGATVTLPSRAGSPELPLLVAFRSASIVPAALAAFPAFGDALRRVVVRGLEAGDPETNPFSYSSSSLLIEALLGDGAGAGARTLSALGRDFVACWPDRDRFGTYHEPSTTFTMNALEYAARRLCHLTNLEDLVVVR
jgi:hypothetical protein